MIVSTTTHCWGLATGWIIYSCYFELNPRLNSFLSHKIWKPLSELTLSIYLVNPIVMMAYTVRQPKIDFGIFDFVKNFVVICIASTLFEKFIRKNIHELGMRFIKK